MFQWIWAYLGVVSLGLIVLSLTRHHFTRQRHLLHTDISSYVSALEAEFHVPVKIIDAQRVQAYAHRRAAHLSVGLIERLNRDEVRAVVAHEAYHVKHSPSKLVSSLAALSSLTFVPYNDEHLADQYAAGVVGKETLAHALRKLDIVGAEQRIENLLMSD